MVDEVNYRCVNTACGRELPRPVAFCPFCGASQRAGAKPKPVPVATPAPAPVPVPEPLKVQPEAVRVAPAPAPAPAQQPKPKSIPKATPVPVSNQPQIPVRKPIRMRTWIMACIALIGIWMFSKPGDVGKKLDARVDAAIALTTDCKMDQARSELAELKSAKASQPQLQRLQTAISATGPACEKTRLRGKAWAETESAVYAALQEHALDKAAGRLAAFSRRWGDDPDSLELGGKIVLRKAERLLDEADACLSKSDRVCLENRLIAAERFKRPELEQRLQSLRDSLSRLLESSLLGAPQTAATAPAPAVLNTEPPRVISTAPAAPAANQNLQQARKILSDAERELAQGNYKGAIDKADICATMIDAGNRACLALKQKAERLNSDMLRCVAGGADWVNDRCH